MSGCTFLRGSFSYLHAPNAFPWRKALECRTKGFPYEGKLSAVRLTDEVGAVSSPLPPKKPADRGRERRELLDQEAAEGLNDGGIIQADDRPQDTFCALGKQRSYGQHQRRQGREDPCSQQPPATLSCDPGRQPDGCQRAQQNAARKEPELRHAEPVKCCRPDCTSCLAAPPAPGRAPAARPAARAGPRRRPCCRRSTAAGTAGSHSASHHR